MFKAVTQFSVFLVSKPGILAQVCDELAGSRINLVALTLMDSVEHGVFRFVAEDPARARAVMGRLNIPTTESQVLLAEMPNRPGAMADVCARLNSNHVSIRYAYVTSGAAGGRTTGIFKVDDLRKAMKVVESRPAGRKERKVSRVERGTRMR